MQISKPSGRWLKAMALSSILTSIASPLLADENHGAHKPVRADGHAPIGVMGDHLHKKGEWMLSYRYMYMDMEGSRIGTNRVSRQEIAADPTIAVVPTKMAMQMHMLGAMYAPSDRITLMAMLPILDKDMDHITFAGGDPDIVKGTFNTRATGLGDINLSSLIGIYNNGTTNIHLNAGLSLPTGSITERDDVLSPMAMGPQNPTLRLPYAMQLGTGTFDLLPGITLQSRSGDFSYGAQYMARIHLGTNDEGYSWGDKHELTAWAAYQWAPWISTSLRVIASTQDTIDGRDSQIGAPVQTADPDNYGGERIDLLGGVNLIVPSGTMKGHRFALEAGAPIYQDLNGPQMERDFTLTFGWQKAF